MAFEDGVVFLRKYQLFVGDNKDTREKAIDPSITIRGTEDFTSITQGSIEITSVRLKAKISATKQSRSATSSPCTISLYNLSSDTKARIRQGFSVVLKAGYETDPELATIFAGEAVNVVTKREGADLITTIVCADSSFANNNLKAVGSLPPNTTAFDVINQMLGKLRSAGIPTASVPVPTQENATTLGAQIPDGYVYEGPIMDKLAEVAKAVNYRVYTSLGKVFVEPEDRPTLAAALNILPENIKGQVQPESYNNSTSDKDKAAKVGLSLTTFLDGRVTLTKFIQLTQISADHVGTYQPTEVTHRLDTEGNTWDTDMTLVRAT